MRSSRILPFLIVLVAGCTAGTSPEATGVPTHVAATPSTVAPTQTASPTSEPTSRATPTAVPTPSPTPDLGAIGQQYLALAKDLSLTFCKVGSVVGGNPTLHSWKAGLKIEIPALQQASSGLRALGAPQDVQSLINAAADALDAQADADRAMAGAKKLNELNLVIDTLLADALNREHDAAVAARKALGLPAPSSVSCKS